jgi:glycosyltransferase involved in cell wall biosynthesis
MGGGPTHIRNMLSSPLKDRYRLLHFETGSRGKESPSEDERFHRKFIRIVTSPFTLASQVIHSWPDVVHLNSGIDPKAFWRDAVYMFVCKLLRRKVVVQMHGGSLEVLTTNPGMRRLVRNVYSISDALVLLANSEKRDFTNLGITEHLSIIPNAVDTDQYNGASERVHSGKVCRLAFMGRLIRPKGMFEAMEAVRLLRVEKQFRDIELWIAGSGAAEEEIERWIEEKGMQMSVKLVGPLYGKDKIDFLRKADVLVFPTYFTEGLPYVILESLAAGTPVIASRVAGIPDVVVDKVHGMLIDARDPQQIVSAVHELARSEEDLLAMSRNCRAWAVQEFGLERLARQFGELYERLQE